VFLEYRVLFTPPGGKAYIGSFSGRFVEKALVVVEAFNSTLRPSFKCIRKDIPFRAQA